MPVKTGVDLVGVGLRGSADDRRLIITGAPGSGKTAALAARAARLGERGQVIAICSHPSSCVALREALERCDAPATVVVDTLGGHLARWLRANYASSGAPADLEIGDGEARKETLAIAARGLLDLAWPELASGVDLDLPHLSRPAAFLDVAAELFRTLRRSRVTADDFEQRCRSGTVVFYGDDVESTQARLNEIAARGRLSRRGRAAVAVGPDALRQQKRAEAGLVEILARLYREYVSAAVSSRVKSNEDVIDEGLRWLEREPAAATAIAAPIAGVIVDDAEDAEPALPQLLSILGEAGVADLAIAGWEDAAIDGFEGRRPALKAPDGEASTMTLTPPPPPERVVRRFDTEEEEIGWLAGRVDELLSNGVAPSDIALLTRGEDAAALYAAALGRSGVPALPPPQRFAAPEDIADLLALGAVVENPTDVEFLLRVVASPLLGLSDAGVWALCRGAGGDAQLQLDLGIIERERGAKTVREKGALVRNVWQGSADDVLPETARTTMAAFRARLLEWARRAESSPPARVLAMLLAEAGFALRWRLGPEHLRARLADDGQRVVEAAIGYAADGRPGPLGRLARACVDGTMHARPAHRVGMECNAIVAAKGRRWQHVFVAGVSYERFPRIYLPRAMAFSPTFGLLVRENVGPGPAQTAKFAWYYAKHDAKKRYLDEERRALRYGLTRATISATATGFGRPPPWAADHDLLQGSE